MTSMTDALFNGTDLEAMIRAQTRIGLTFVETRSGWGPIFFDSDEDID